VSLGNLFLVVCKKLVGHYPHLSHVITELEGGNVLSRFEVELNFVQIDKLSLQFLELGVIRVQRFKEKLDTRMTSQKLENLLTLLLDIFGVCHVLGGLLLL
jgi:hypothetical protein